MAEENPRIKAYVINRACDEQRWQNMCAWLQASGIAFERIAAVEGTDLDHAARWVSPLARIFMYRSLSAREVGCFLSHRRAWKRALAEGAPVALVLEDDAVPRDGALATLARIKLQSPGLDMLRLHVHNESDAKTKLRGLGPASSKGTGAILRRQGKPVFSMTAYLLTPAGARKLLRYRKLWAPVDWLTYPALKTGLTHAVAWPPLFENDARFGSTVQDDATSLSASAPTPWRRNAGALQRKFLKRFLLPLTEELLLLLAAPRIMSKGTRLAIGGWLGKRKQN